MNVDLFSQTLLFILYLASFSILIWMYFWAYEQESRRQRWIERAIAVIFAVLFGACVRYGVKSSFPQDPIPIGLIIWAMPVGLSFWGLCRLLRAPKKLPLAFLGLLASLVLSLVITNNYYHYYPTLSAALAQDRLATAQMSTPFGVISLPNRAVFEQYFQSLPGQPSSGVLQALNIPSSSRNFTPRVGRIYLPPALINNPQLQLPVIVLLSGLPGSPLQWEQSGIKDIMDTFATQHKGLAPIVAMVDFSGAQNQDTECTDSPRGNAETYLTKDVPAYLRQNFPVQDKPDYWAIGGYSAGGTCGPLIALRNSNVYRNYFNISGDAEPSIGTSTQTLATLYGGSEQRMRQHTIATLLADKNPAYAKMSAWYYIGAQDTPARVLKMKQQVALAKSAGITTMLTEIPGSHTFVVWKQGFVEGLPWLSHQMGLTIYATKK